MRTKKLITKFIFALFFILILSSCSKKNKAGLSIAFYKMTLQTAEKMEKAITDIYKDNSKKVSFNYIDDEKALNKLIKSKSIQIVFTTAGNNQRTCVKMANKNSAIPDAINSDMTSSISQKLIFDKDSNDFIAAAPVLSDNFEIDINTYDFNTSKVPAINTWDDVEQFLTTQKRTSNHPLYFAGADSITFFDMLGAICEAVDGSKYYEQSLAILDKGGNPNDIADELMGGATSPMVNTANLLKNYFRKGFFSQDCFNLKPKDLERFALEDYAKMMIMPLSDHRTINYNAISRYSSAYIPSEYGAALRTFTANIIYAIPVNKSLETADFINNLYTDENQLNLSRNTGLAPVVRNCRIPDKQADDARYWIAATNSPFAGLGHDTKLSKEELDNIKSCIKNILLYQ